MELESKNVAEIQGTFTVPAYQRGYRWEKQQVMDLLDDILDAGGNLCLQPVVVKAKGDDLWELIDGQQRLTTLYLIYRFMKDEGYKPRIDLPFSLEYETRPKSREYLTRPDEKGKNDNVDFYHIYHSYQAIKEWFGEDTNQAQSKADRIYPKFDSNIFMIWYEVDEKTDASRLFTRLNAGKIPLTNAELIKAKLFLSVREEGKSTEWANLKQIEIATQWDAMERELHNEEFWAFLTNTPGDAYPARIGLLFDILSQDEQHEGNTRHKQNEQHEQRHEFQTFRWFEKRLKNDENNKAGKADRLWDEIQETFQMLRSWYEDRDLYHAIGYLVACGAEKLSYLVSEAKKHTKGDFKKILEKKIKKSLELNKLSLDDLSYESHKKTIEKILLFFNTKETKEMKNSLERYPFSLHKKEHWSLEHIHAQNAEELRTEEEWREWLTEHKKALEKIDPHNAILEKLYGVLKEKDKGGIINSETFRKIQWDVSQALSDKDEDRDIHGLGNLALMPLEENAALSNSVFAVKRQKIIKMDREGNYIPIGTRRVFLKYYGDGQNRLHLWSPSDYDAYFKKIEDVLKPYLSEEGER